MYSGGVTIMFTICILRYLLTCYVVLAQYVRASIIILWFVNKVISCSISPLEEKTFTKNKVKRNLICMINIDYGRQFLYITVEIFYIYYMWQVSQAINIFFEKFITYTNYFKSILQINTYLAYPYIKKKNHTNTKLDK